MNDFDFIRTTSMLVLPKCIERASNPIKEAVDLAYELLRECERREKEENL